MSDQPDPIEMLAELVHAAIDANYGPGCSSIGAGGLCIDIAWWLNRRASVHFRASEGGSAADTDPDAERCFRCGHDPMGDHSAGGCGRCGCSSPFGGLT